MTDRERFLESAIKRALESLEQLPNGIDPDPDLDDPSPSDAGYFIGGVVTKILTEALDGRDWP